MTTTLARRRAAADPDRAYPTSRGERTPKQIRRLAATGMRVLITRLEPAHEQSRLELYPHEDVLIVTDDDRRALPRWTAELGSPVLEVAEYHRQLLHEEITRMPSHERIELFYTERELGETLLMTIRARGTTAMRATFAPVVDPQRRARLQALVPAARFQLPTAARRALDPVQAWPLIEQAVRAAGLSEDICKLLVATAAAAETPEAIASIPIPTHPTKEH